MKFSKDVDRSIRILKKIQINGSINAKDIASCIFNMTDRQVMFLCKKLVDADILSSTRGPKGGYSIKRIPTLYELVMVFDKDSSDTESWETFCVYETHLKKIHCDLLAAMDSIFIL